MKRTLYWYVTSEILPPFAVGLLVFTIILLTARILKLVELLVTRGVSFLQISNLLALILPTFIEMTVPMALLLGILFGLGRLSSDLEMTALKTLGFSPVQILLPIGLFALIISLITLLITTWVRPAANSALKKQLYSLAKGRVTTALKENVFNNDFPNVLIYVEEVIPPGITSKGVLIVDRRDSEKQNIILGKVALFLTDEESRTLSLKLFDGVIHEKEKNRSEFSQTHFNVYHFRLDFEEAFRLGRRKQRGPKEMLLPQLGEAIRLKEEQGLKPTSELLELHRRFAFPFAPLIFSLLGVSLVMVPARHRASRSWGLTSCLFWLLLYYGLLSTGKALGERELVPPMLALWIPNIVVGLIALYFFRKAIRETPSWLEGMWEKFILFFNRNPVPEHRKLS